MFTSIIYVAFGGGLGAVSRFLTSTVSASLFGVRFPYGTLLVNSLGSFLAGFLMILFMERFAFSDNWRLFLVVGFLGGFTTFSSFSWETWAFFEGGEHFKALTNVFLNNVFALGLALFGIHCGRWIGG